jgi:hypothetical protein
MSTAVQFEIACVDQDALPFFQQIFDHRVDATQAFTADAVTHAGRCSPGHLLRLTKGRVIMEKHRWGGTTLVSPSVSLGHRALVPASEVIMADGTVLTPIIRHPIFLAATWNPIDHTEVASFSLIVTDSGGDGQFHPVLVPPNQCLDWLDSSRDVRSLQRPVAPQWNAPYRRAA